MARTELQVLINEPVTIIVGTADAPISVEIKEPMQAELGKYLTLLNVSLKQLLKDNIPLLQAAYAGHDVSQIPMDLSAVAGIFSKLVAAIMGREEQWVSENVTPRQQAAIVQAFLDVLGWDFIKETFRQAMRGWKGQTPKSENDSAPSWSVGASPTSPGHTN